MFLFLSIKPPVPRLYNVYLHVSILLSLCQVSEPPRLYIVLPVMLVGLQRKPTPHKPRHHAMQRNDRDNTKASIIRRVRSALIPSLNSGPPRTALIFSEGTDIASNQCFLTSNATVPLVASANKPGDQSIEATGE